MRYTPKPELERRIAKLQSKLLQRGIDGAVIVQNADLFYFSGTIQQSHLFVPAAGKPVLMVKKSLERARMESPMDVIVALDSLRRFNELLRYYSHDNIECLGFELDVLPVNQYYNYRQLVSPARIVDVSPLIREVRMIKSSYEIEILKDVARLQNEMFDVTKEYIREGVSELELTGAVASASRKSGHSGYIRVRGFNQDLYYLHLLSGDNTLPSYFAGSVGGRGVGPSFAQGSSDKLIRRNEPVLVDYNFVYDGYMMDQTRVLCLGQLPEHLTGSHTVAMDILADIEKKAVPGMPCDELYNLAIEAAHASGYGAHFLGFPAQVAFVGHGIGIELDELPVIGRGFATPLEEGMVFALEPKFVFPDGAVGLENTYVVTENGLEKLTVYEEDIIYINE